MTTMILGSLETKSKTKTISDWLRRFFKRTGEFFEAWDMSYRERARARNELRDRYGVDYYNLIHKL